MDEEDEVTMNEEQDVDDGKEMVGVPEGVEARQPVERRWKSHNVLAETPGREREGDGHEDDHGDSSGPHNARNKPSVRWQLVPEIRRYQREFTRRCCDQTREVAGQMVPRVHDDPDRDGKSYCLCNFH